MKQDILQKNIELMLQGHLVFESAGELKDKVDAAETFEGKERKRK